MPGMPFFYSQSLEPPVRRMLASSDPREGVDNRRMESREWWIAANSE
jgi:hypothetical protein